MFPFETGQKVIHTQAKIGRLSATGRSKGDFSTPCDIQFFPHPEGRARHLNVSR